MKIAIIFAGGSGKRLKPLTAKVHKSLVKINGTPLIENLILNLQNIVDKTIIITGYKKDDFNYLKDKFKNIELIFNVHFKDYGTAYPLALLEKLFDGTNSIFIISGDFVMKQNCFLNLKQENIMAGFKRKPENNKKDWCYRLNEVGEIIGLELTDNAENIEASEWSYLSEAFCLMVKNDLNYVGNSYFHKEMIGKYLIDASLRNKMPLKPYLISYDDFWDLDNKADLNRIKEQFEQKTDT